MGDVVIGTCSWTERTMLERWYPREVSTPEARLRYYSARFDTVEVDSAFYGIPQRRYAEQWVRRTPPGFVFHVKAYGMMTRHEVDERSLHPELRGYSYEVTDRGRVRRPERAMLEKAFDLFCQAIAPLAESGKLGGVLMQFPSYVTALHPDKRRESLQYLEWAQELLGEGLPGAPMLVEFRHPSWVSGAQCEQTMRFLAERGMTYVSVDAPQFPDRSTMPPITAATSAWAYVRLHGRNRDTFFARVASAADRFDYLYTPDELREWEQPIRRLAEETERTWVMFNNCKYDYAPRNAREIAEILGDVVAPRRGGVPTGEPTPDVQRDTPRAPRGSRGSPAGDGGQLGLWDPSRPRVPARPCGHARQRSLQYVRCPRAWTTLAGV